MASAPFTYKNETYPTLIRALTARIEDVKAGNEPEAILDADECIVSTFEIKLALAEISNLFDAMGMDEMSRELDWNLWDQGRHRMVLAPTVEAMRTFDWES